MSGGAQALFVLGCPRSGTSIVFKTLAAHPDVCTTTNLTRRFGARFPLVRLAERLGARHRPVEAGPLWKAIWPPGTRERMADEVTGEQREALQRLVTGHREHFGRPLFVGKRPGLTLRLRWLAAALPEARFLHVVRDGRAVANSVLRECKAANRHWSYVGRELWPDLGALDFASYSGALWSRIALTADRAAAELDGRVHTLRYEDFVRRPREALRQVAAFAGLSWTDAHDALLPELRDRNDKWRRELDETEQRLVLSHAEPGLRHFGYL